jgi:hypothetical protein
LFGENALQRDQFLGGALLSVMEGVETIHLITEETFAFFDAQVEKVCRLWRGRSNHDFRQDNCELKTYAVATSENSCMAIRGWGPTMDVAIEWACAGVSIKTFEDEQMSRKNNRLQSAQLDRLRAHRRAPSAPGE